MNRVIVTFSLFATVVLGITESTVTTTDETTTTTTATTTTTTTLSASIASSTTTAVPIPDLKKLFESDRSLFVNAVEALKSPAKTEDWFKDAKDLSKIKADKVIAAANAFTTVKLSTPSDKLASLTDALTNFQTQVGSRTTVPDTADQKRISEAYAKVVTSLTAVVAESQDAGSSYVIYIVVGLLVFSAVALLLFCQCRKRSNV